MVFSRGFFTLLNFRRAAVPASFATSSFLFKGEQDLGSSSSSGKKAPYKEKPAKSWSLPRQEDFIRREDYKKTIEGSYRNLRVSMVGGNVILLPGAENVFTLRLQWVGDENPDLLPKFDVNDDNTIILESHSLKPFIGQKNAYIAEVSMPAATNASISMFGGTIYLGELNGEIDLNMKAGSVESIAHSANVVASVGIGSLKMHGLQGSADINVGMGDASLSFDEVLDNSRISVVTKLADAKLRFPPSFLNSPIFSKVGGNTYICNKKDANVTVSTWTGDVDVCERDSDTRYTMK